MVRKYICILLAILTILIGMITGKAAETDRERDFIGELELPLELSFSVQEQCSGHPYFHHAIAQNDGKFAVFSHYIDPKGRNSETFVRQYIDVYHSDGSFAKEFTFCTLQAYTPVLEENKIYIYFYSYVITIDLETEELHCYDIVDAYEQKEKVVDVQQPKIFQSGKWEYRCKRAFNGYNILTRSNGTMEQVVVTMSGRVLPAWHHISSVLGAAIIVIVVLLIKKKTGDGSVS